MPQLAAYIVTGILIAGAYDQLPAFFRLTYGFVFPIHWGLMMWGQAIFNARRHGILDNEPLWIGLLVFFVILTLVCG